MRVYCRGVPIRMRDVTWSILCDPETSVDWGQDTHIPVWPDHIVEARNQAIADIERVMPTSGHRLIKRFSKIWFNKELHL